MSKVTVAGVDIDTRHFIGGPRRFCRRLHLRRPQPD